LKLIQSDVVPQVSNRLENIPFDNKSEISNFGIICRAKGLKISERIEWRFIDKSSLPSSQGFGHYIHGSVTNE